AQISTSGYQQTDLLSLDRGDACPIPLVISPWLMTLPRIAPLVLTLSDAFCDWVSEHFKSEKKGEARLPLYLSPIKASLLR
ncbi:MAG: hypothetical protein MKZ98_14215, partial [Pseudomonadales bacterium]|nr:hypothetical protein [Pseudomonadales bacterium]